MQYNIALLLALLSLISPQANAISTNPDGNMYLANTPETVVLNVPFVHQVNDLTEEDKPVMLSSACGPASITMALNYLGDKHTLSEVIDLLPTEVYVKGKMFYNLTLAPKFFNREAVAFPNSYTNIFTSLKQGNPVILNIQNYNGFVGHAVVVVGIKNYDGHKADSLVVHDPFVGPYREFNYIDEKTLKQPEGYYNYIGILQPFYVQTKTVDIVLASK